MTTNQAHELAKRVHRIKPSPTLAISARAEELQAEGKKILNLSVGEPDFDTPQHIKQAAINAIQAGHTKYTAVDGIKPLKEAIIQKFARDNHQTFAHNQILVSCGAKHSLSNFFSSVLNLEDEVIIPAPYWVSYPDMVLLADGKPVILETKFADDFKMTPAQLASTITDRTRVLILNSPSNPTGVAYTLNELKALAEVILKHPKLLVVSDDIYESNLWDQSTFANILNACPLLKERCVIVNGVSKAYAMTGWRIGYAAGPTSIIGAMKKIQSQNTSSPTSISQYAALAALTGDQACIKSMAKAYRERHDYVLGELKRIPGIKCLPANGTFYLFPCIKDLLKEHTKITTDLELAEYLLTAAEIAVVPGSAFGTPGHIRLSYATSMTNLIEAMQRCRHALQQL